MMYKDRCWYRKEETGQVSLDMSTKETQKYAGQNFNGMLIPNASLVRITVNEEICQLAYDFLVMEI